MLPSLVRQLLILLLIGLPLFPATAKNVRCGILIAAHSDPNLKAKIFAAFTPQFEMAKLHRAFDRAVLNLAHQSKFRRLILTAPSGVISDLTDQMKHELDRPDGFAEITRGWYGTTPFARKRLVDTTGHDLFEEILVALRGNLLATANRHAVPLERLITLDGQGAFHDFVLAELLGKISDTPEAFDVTMRGEIVASWLPGWVDRWVAHEKTHPYTVDTGLETEFPEDFTTPVARQFWAHHYALPRPDTGITFAIWSKAVFRLGSQFPVFAHRLGFPADHVLLSFREMGYSVSDLRRELEYEIFKLKLSSANLSAEGGEGAADRAALAFLKRYEMRGALDQVPQIIGAFQTHSFHLSDPDRSRGPKEKRREYRDSESLRWRWMADYVSSSVEQVCTRYGISAEMFWDEYEESTVLLRIGEEAARWKELGLTIAYPPAEARFIVDYAVRGLAAPLVAREKVKLPEDWADQLLKYETDRSALLARIPEAEIAATLALWSGAHREKNRRELFISIYRDFKPAFAQASKTSASNEGRIAFARFMQLRGYFQVAPQLLSTENLSGNAPYVWELEEKMRSLATGYGREKPRAAFTKVLTLLEAKWVAGELSDRSSFLRTIDELARAEIAAVLTQKKMGPPPGDPSGRSEPKREIPTACHVKPFDLPQTTDVQWQKMCRAIPEVVEAEGAKFGFSWEQFWKLDETDVTAATGEYTGEDVVDAIRRQTEIWYGNYFQASEKSSAELEILRRAIRDLGAKLYRKTHSELPTDWEAKLKKKRLDQADVYLMIPEADRAAIRPIWKRGLVMDMKEDDPEARDRLFSDFFDLDVPGQQLTDRHPEETSDGAIRAKKVGYLRSFIWLWQTYRDPQFTVLCLIPPSSLEGYDAVWKSTQRALHKELQKSAVGINDFWTKLASRISAVQWVIWFAEELGEFDEKIQKNVGRNHIAREVAQRLLVRAGLPRTVTAILATPAFRKLAVSGSDDSPGVSPSPSEEPDEVPNDVAIGKETANAAEALPEVPIVESVPAAPIPPSRVRPAMPVNPYLAHSLPEALRRPVAKAEATPKVVAAVEEEPIPDLSHIHVPPAFVDDLEKNLSDLIGTFQSYYRVRGSVEREGGSGRFGPTALRQRLIQEAQLWYERGYGKFREKREAEMICIRAVRRALRLMARDEGVTVPANWSELLEDRTDPEALAAMIPRVRLRALADQWGEASGPDAVSRPDFALFRRTFIDEIPDELVYRPRKGASEAENRFHYQAEKLRLIRAFMRFAWPRLSEK